jgi:hypothetical protein
VLAGWITGSLLAAGIAAPAHPTVEDDGSRFREVMTNHFTATRFLGMLI